MKKIIALMLTVGILLFVGGTAAFADHKQGHQNPPACQKGSKAPNQNKHCYPPGPNSSNSSGQPASFTTESPAASGLTVGMASLIAAGAVGALLVVRRRWMFRTSRR